jgi:hypothetical protein
MRGKFWRIGLGAVIVLFFWLSAPPTATPQVEQQRQQNALFEDFSSQEVGQFPDGWRWRRDRDTGTGEEAVRKQIDVFRWVIAEEDGNKYLHIRDEHREGHSVSVYLEVRKKSFEWRIDEYPILSWRWRVNEVPPGADERITERNDTPASVLVVFGKKFPWTPISIRYAWSSTLPAGVVAYRPGRGRPYVIVLNSGTERLGEWITIERDIYQDYVEIFGSEPPDRPEAIVLSSDANRTPGGAADADYDDIRVLTSYSDGYPREPHTLLKQYVPDTR